MRRLSIAALVLISGCSTMQTSDAFDSARLHEIDRTIETAIAEHKLPGGVFHLERGSATYDKVYGNRALVHAVEPMTADTIFDGASLTKVVATTPSIWLLIERSTLANLTRSRICASGCGTSTYRRLTAFPILDAIEYARSALVTSFTLPRRK